MDYLQWILIIEIIIQLIIICIFVFFNIKKIKMSKYINIFIIILYLLSLYIYVTEYTNFKCINKTYNIKDYIEQNELPKDLINTNYYNSIKNELNKHYFDTIQLNPKYKKINLIDFIKGEITLNNKYIIDNREKSINNSKYIEINGQAKIKYTTDFKTNIKTIKYIEIGEYKLGIDLDKKILFINPNKITYLKIIIKKDDNKNGIIKNYKILDISPCSKESTFDIQ